MTTVCCVWVKGQVPFTIDYVTNLQSMVRRHLHLPHRFVCLTDRPQKLPDGIVPVVVPTPPRKGWWAKLQAFNSSHGFSGRMLYLDLDTLVVADLAPVVRFPASFALVPPGGNFVPNNGTTTVWRYNSSVMVWDSGCNSELFDAWTPDVVNRLHGDQDWIGERYPHADTFPAEWMPRISDIIETAGPPASARVVLMKKPKNHAASARWPWVNELWR